MNYIVGCPPEGAGIGLSRSHDCDPIDFEPVNQLQAVLIGVYQ